MFDKANLTIFAYTMKKKISIEYQEYELATQLKEEDQFLLQKAISACGSSYSPYSRFKVGVAVKLADGQIITAANQESVAFPSGLCAERSALFYILANYPKIPVVAMAIAAKRGAKLVDSPTRPCGACVQVMLDAQNRGGVPIKVILGGAKKIEIINSINDLLPFSFVNFEES